MKEKIRTKAELIALIQRADIKEIAVYSTDKLAPAQQVKPILQDFTREIARLVQDKRPIYLIGFKIG